MRGQQMTANNILYGDAGVRGENRQQIILPLPKQPFIPDAQSVGWILKGLHNIFTSKKAPLNIPAMNLLAQIRKTFPEPFYYHGSGENIRLISSPQECANDYNLKKGRGKNFPEWGERSRYEWDMILYSLSVLYQEETEDNKRKIAMAYQRISGGEILERQDYLHCCSCEQVVTDKDITTVTTAKETMANADRNKWFCFNCSG